MNRIYAQICPYLMRWNNSTHSVVFTILYFCVDIFLNISIVMTIGTLSVFFFLDYPSAEGTKQQCSGQI